MPGVLHGIPVDGLKSEDNMRSALLKEVQLSLLLEVSACAVIADYSNGRQLISHDGRQQQHLLLNGRSI